MMKRILLWIGVVLCFTAWCSGSLRAEIQEGSEPCNELTVEECPSERCDILVNCRGQEICYFKMIDPPQCGNLSYAGQDVPCCPGLVRRCGVAFLDMTCDMEGDHSPYHLPICIPCGDGICGNFENACNCPEDCWPGGGREYTGQRFDLEALPEEDQD